MSEFTRFRSLVREFVPAADQPAVLSLMDTIEKLVANLSPSGLVEFLPHLAEYEPEALVQFGRLVTIARKAITRQAEGLLDNIRSHYAEHLKSKLPELVPPPPPPGGLGGVVVPPPGGVRTSSSGVPVRLASTRVAGNAESRGVLSIQATAIDPEEVARVRRGIEAPSLEDAAAWAFEHRPALVAQLQAIALQLSPVRPTYSEAGPVSMIMRIVPALEEWGESAAKMTAGFESRRAIQPVGRLHLERIEMASAGVERGELVHSVPMTPNETVNISHRQWAVHAEEFDKIVTDFFEGYSEEGVAEKTDALRSTESESKHSQALNVGASLSANFSSVTISSSFGFQQDSQDTQSEKESRAHSLATTRKATARTRRDNKFSFKVSSVAGTEDQAVRVITNPSETKSMRVDYFPHLIHRCEGPKKLTRLAEA